MTTPRGCLKSITTALKRFARYGDVEGFRAYIRSEAFLAAALGIAIIGCLNFGVSFVLALAVALRARQADRSDRLRLMLSVLATFARSPLQFFIPPRQNHAARVHGPVTIPPRPAT